MSNQKKVQFVIQQGNLESVKQDTNMSNVMGNNNQKIEKNDNDGIFLIQKEVQHSKVSSSAQIAKMKKIMQKIQIQKKKLQSFYIDQNQLFVKKEQLVQLNDQLEQKKNVERQLLDIHQKTIIQQKEEQIKQLYQVLETKKKQNQQLMANELKEKDHLIKSIFDVEKKISINQRGIKQSLVKTRVSKAKQSQIKTNKEEQELYQTAKREKQLLDKQLILHEEESKNLSDKIIELKNKLLKQKDNSRVVDYIEQINKIKLKIDNIKRQNEKNEQNKTKQQTTTNKIQLLKVQKIQLKRILKDKNKEKDQKELQVQEIKNKNTEINKKQKQQEQRINKQKAKNEKIKQEIVRLNKQYTKIQQQLKEQKQHKKIYQQKIPQQYTSLLKKKQILIKQINKLKNQYQQHLIHSQNLIPQNIIDQLKIKIQSMKKKYTTLLLFIEQNGKLEKQQKQLRIINDELEWGVNPKLNELQKYVQLEQQKMTNNDEILVQVKKTSTQLVSKLDNYAKAYPEYKLAIKNNIVVTQSEIIPKNQNRKIGMTKSNIIQQEQKKITATNTFKSVINEMKQQEEQGIVQEDEENKYPKQSKNKRRKKKNIKVENKKQEEKNQIKFQVLQNQQELVKQDKLKQQVLIKQKENKIIKQNQQKNKIIKQKQQKQYQKQQLNEKMDKKQEKEQKIQEIKKTINNNNSNNNNNNNNNNVQDQKQLIKEEEKKPKKRKSKKH